MKIPCTCPANLLSSRFIKSAFLSAAMASLAIAAQAAIITPLSVPSGGVAVTFDVIPTLATGWATKEIAGGNGAPAAAANSPAVNQAAVDAAVQTNAVADFTVALPEDRSGTTPLGTAPDTSQLFRWNSARKLVFSRPTGIAYTTLLLGLRNDSGQDRGSVTIDYDFGVDVGGVAGQTDQEDPGTYGYRVYYSLTGAANTWVHIADLDTATNNGAGPKHSEITLPSAWESGANLYFLWADDNGQSQSTENDAAIEGPYTIDNVAIGFGGPKIAPSFTAQGAIQPHNVTVEQCRDTNLTAEAVGSLPITYQWFRGNPPGTLIPGATATTYNLNVADPAQSGPYFLHAVNSQGAADSAVVQVNVTADSDAPTIVSGLAKVDGTNFIVTFSERMNPLDINGNPFSFHLHPLAGGLDTDATGISLSADARVATVSFDVPRTANANYELIVDPSMFDCSTLNLITGPVNGNGQIIVTLTYEVHVMSITNTPWKYRDDGIDLGTTWHHLVFNDSAWSNGVSVLDAKDPEPPGRTTIAGFPVQTQLQINNALWPRTAGGVTNDIPTIYFRTHFNIPTSPNGVVGLSLRTLTDDADVAYLNDGGPVHRNTRYTNTVDMFEYCTGNIGDATVEGPFKLSVADVHGGDNLISASLHQNGATSSDFTFAYELTAEITSFVTAGPALQVSYDGTNVHITWSDPTAQLYQAGSVDAAPGAWSLIGGGGSATVAPSSGQKFYTLRR